MNGGSHEMCDIIDEAKDDTADEVTNPPSCAQDHPASHSLQIIRQPIGVNEGAYE